jgi:predicted RNase H-like HicB family nuclease
MAQRKFRMNIVLSYEPDESGWIRASLPAMPEVVTAGVSREDAREMVIDTLMQLLSIEPERRTAATTSGCVSTSSRVAPHTRNRRGPADVVSRRHSGTSAVGGPSDSSAGAGLAPRESDGRG